MRTKPAPRRSLERALSLAGSGVILAALTLTGLLTAAILHLRAVSALDEALLAAAHAHSGRHPTWEVEHSASPVEVWVAHADEQGLSSALLNQVARAERPISLNIGEDRLLLLPAERDGHDGDEHHLVIAARAPAVTLGSSVGGFALVYLLVAAAAALGSAALLRSLTRRGLSPVGRAVREVGTVFDLGQGARLTEEGPDEILGFLRAINGLLDRLDAAHRAQIRFSDEAAHELRTPLTVLRGELDLALRRPREAEAYRASLASMREEVTRLGALVDGLLSLARLDAGTAPEAEEISASELVSSVVTAQERALAEAGCPLSVERRGEARARVSRALVEAALSNLLRNAAVHAPGSPVRLAVEASDGLLRFIVEDRGPGVPEGQQEAVFDRLARGGEARRRDRAGLGLGLPLAREVARRHGGDCVIETADGGGCRVTLSLRALPDPPRRA